MITKDDVPARVNAVACFRIAPPNLLKPCREHAPERARNSAPVEPEHRQAA